MWNQVVFAKRRWLGLRKPSQGKDKAPGAQSPATADKHAPLKKIPSDKKLKLPYGSDHERSEEGESSQAAAALDEVEDDAADLELPPPMKPIQDPQAVLQAPAQPAAASNPSRKLHNHQEQHGGPGGSGKSGTSREPEEEEPYELMVKKREFVLRELVDTEEIYVSDLRLVCEGYIRHFQLSNPDPPIPEGLRDRRHRMIFGNIEAIYEWHRDKFLRDVQECVKAPEMLGPLFQRFFEKRMFMYEAYCRNKPVSEYIVSEHDHFFQELRNKLGHKLQLGDLLIKPIQRIQKYHLLVKKILIFSEHSQTPPEVISSLREAMTYTDIIPKNANMMMDVGRLQGFTGNITSQGKLLMQEQMSVVELGTNEKPKELHVFLFEQCVIFSEAVGKRSQYTSPTYNYRAHVQMNKMELEEIEQGAAFIINSVDPNKPRQSFLCRPPEATRSDWIATLFSILQSQRMFGEALENPGAYLRELQGHGAAGALRKTESVPPSLGARLAPELRQRQRPHAKANTINLPATPSPTSPPHANV